MVGRPIPSAAMLHLYVLGPFQLCDASNRPLTIRNRKAQALLALLALSPRGERSRVWLRDKLWSGSDERRSSTNLRQTLFELRRDLGSLADRAMDFGTQTISFRPGRIWVDHHALTAEPQAAGAMGISDTTELLEGFDIGDPEFEDWLSLERGLWADKIEALIEGQSQGIVAKPALISAATPQPAPKQTSIALMPNVLHGADSLGLHLADRVMEGIANSLRELQPIAILDLRSLTGPIEDLAASAHTEFYCRLRLLRIGENVTLTLFLHRVSRLAMEWSHSIQCPLDDLVSYDGQVLQGFIAQSVDRLARSLMDSIPREEPKNELYRSGYAALNLIFRLEETALDRAVELLKPKEDEGPGLHAALRSYISSFRVGENLGVLTEQARETIRRETARQMDRDPFNSVSLACFGHVLGYVFQEHEAAGQLLEQAVRMNPAQPFAWDHYALHRMYVGDYEGAKTAANRAVSLGAYSPISYSYETTLAMASTLAGDFDRAVLAGQSALAKQPRFNAAMRYLMVAYAARGDRAAAEAMRDKILLTDPDFRHHDVQETRFGARTMQGAGGLITHIRNLFD